MFEKDFLKFLGPNDLLIGVDEVGRGPLAGPVVTCAFAFYVTKNNDKKLLELKKLGITDSKKLSDKKREAILKAFDLSVDKLKAHQKITLQYGENELGHFYLCEKSHAYIDEKNILVATMDAMDEAVEQVVTSPNWTALIDGNRLPPRIQDSGFGYPVIKGDSQSLVIALASILAKEYRDHLMLKMSKLYPGYGLEKHAGYPTKFHLQALKNLGPSPIHRRTFKGVLQDCQGN